MKPDRKEAIPTSYRVWMASPPDHWKPSKWSDVPPEATALPTSQR
jgi:hypothetical protein